jgi:hypothetical protein
MTRARFVLISDARKCRSKLQRYWTKSFVLVGHIEALVDLKL